MAKIKKIMGFAYMKKHFPEKFIQHQSRAGKIAHIKHPNLSKNVGKKLTKWCRAHPEHQRKAWKICLTKHPNLPSRAGGLKLKAMLKRNPNHQSDAGKIGGMITSKILRMRRNIIWKGVYFASQAEMEVAKKVLEHPIEGVNTHIKIGSREIDFIVNGIFIEYHPWDRNLTDKEYFGKRLQVIENSQYKGTPLIVLKNIDEIDKIRLKIPLLESDINHHSQKIIQQLRNIKC